MWSRIPNTLALRLDDHSFRHGGAVPKGQPP